MAKQKKSNKNTKTQAVGRISRRPKQKGKVKGRKSPQLYGFQMRDHVPNHLRDPEQEAASIQAPSNAVARRIARWRIEHKIR